MPEVAIADLIALRGPAGLLLGTCCGLLLWLVGPMRLGGGAVAAVLVAAAFVGSGWGAGLLLAAAAALPGLAGPLGGALSRESRLPDRPGTAWAGAALALPGLGLFALPVLPVDNYVVAAAAGALAGAVGDGVRAALEGMPGRAYRLHSLRRATGDAGTPPGAALAGAAAALLVAWLGWILQLVGPGAPALVGIAGIVAMIAAAALRDRTRRRRVGGALPATTASLVGAVLAAGLVAFVP